MVVAEGVDSLEQLAVLREMACDQVQGFLYAPAVPADDAVRFLARGSEARPAVPFAASYPGRLDADPREAAAPTAEPAVESEASERALKTRRGSDFGSHPGAAARRRRRRRAARRRGAARAPRARRRSAIRRRSRRSAHADARREALDPRRARAAVDRSPCAGRDPPEPRQANGNGTPDPGRRRRARSARARAPAQQRRLRRAVGALRRHRARLRAEVRHRGARRSLAPARDPRSDRA